MKTVSLIKPHFHISHSMKGNIFSLLYDLKFIPGLQARL